MYKVEYQKAFYYLGAGKLRFISEESILSNFILFENILFYLFGKESVRE